MWNDQLNNTIKSNQSTDLDRRLEFDHGTLLKYNIY